ncbi:MAG: hypothetical protein HC896_03315 [Bacteroidales bacterium]|nr:hypothetical protein [Bacteroidales bacterium]
MAHLIKKLNLRLFLLLFSLVVSSLPQAFGENSLEINNKQIQTITGTVKSMDGMALPGVNISVNGTTIGTVTDIMAITQYKCPGPV